MIYNFLHYYKPYKRILYGVVIGSLVAALLDLIFPMMVRQILNEVLPQKNINRLLQDSGVLFILYLGNYGLLYIVNYYGHLMSAKIENDMRRDLFEHFQKMSFRYFDNAKTGQLLSRLTSDIAEIGELSFRGPNDVIVCCITMVGTIGILFWMNVYLGILIALLLITKTLHTVYVNKKMKAAFRDNRIKSGEITARAEESLGGIRLVKAFAQEEYELARFMEKSLDFLETRRKSYKILAYFSGSVNFFTNITNLLILACGGLLIAKDKLSLSDFVAFLLYVNLFMKPLLRLTVFTEMYQRGMAPLLQEYQRAADKKQFRRKHEGTLILYEAAAKALKEQGFQKLPDLYALKVEYKQLAEQKDQLQRQYTEAKRQMQEYGIIKQNVDSILRTAPGKEQMQER